MPRWDCSAPLFLDSVRQLRRCERSRILDIDCQMLGWLWRRGHQAYAPRRVEAVPRPLRHDDDHPGAHRIGFRTVLRHGVERRRTVDDLHELIAFGWRSHAPSPANLALKTLPSRNGANVAKAPLPFRSTSVICGVRPRSSVNLSNSALRSRIVIILQLLL